MIKPPVRITQSDLLDTFRPLPSGYGPDIYYGVPGNVDQVWYYSYHDAWIRTHESPTDSRVFFAYKTRRKFWVAEFEDESLIVFNTKKEALEYDPGIKRKALVCVRIDEGNEKHG